jgi:transcriptional regulator with PAS, ATPase and Fis domain
MKEPIALVGVSPAIKTIQEDIEYASRSDAKVLVTGESGVGKEVVARLIHEGSSRRNGPLVTINCAGFPESLLETEMFGHTKGSFTDAHRDKRGWLEMAHGGTIFMDEVGEMSLRMQALLLRFLETGEIQRVGSERQSPVLDVRVITATHRRLLDRIADKTFREDLYYRLNVIHIEVPPLRERTEDIPPLLTHFLHDSAVSHRTREPELTPDAVARLLEYRWPGNVRELKNITERLVLRQHGNGLIGPDDLPAEIWKDRRTLAARRAPEPAQPPVADRLFQRMLDQGESFWSAVYEPFMLRDITRDDLRELLRMGLEHTRGNYKMLVAAFNMPPTDYKRFMSLLRKYQCHLPFQQFRTVGPAARSAAGASGNV